MARVLVLGNAGLDISLQTPRLPERGETLLGDAVSRAPGGKGLNQAVSAARARAKVLFQAPIGIDGMADEIRSVLAAEPQLAFEPAAMHEATDFSLLMVLPDGENSIVSGGPCAAGFTPQAAAIFAGRAEPEDIFLAQGNLSLDATIAAFETARTQGAKTVLNPAPIWWDVNRLLPHCDMLIVNANEAEMVSGRTDPAMAIDELCGRGVETVIITLGGDGCLLQSAGKRRRYAAVPVDACDTTGCGDTFCGVLCAALCRNTPLEEAVRFAQAAAAITATRMGAYAALPQRAELDALLGTRPDGMSSQGQELLLDIDHMSVELGPAGKRVRIVRDVSMSLARGRITCVVGESGSGKSVFAMSLMRLMAEEISTITANRALFEGEDLTRLKEREMLRLRGGRMAMIFQEPMTSLNPVFTIGDQIAEAVQLHQQVSKQEARRKALVALQNVHIPAAERRLDAYPHELSGGMRQRVMIAMALACEPSLLIADEPTTALDVTIQAQILALLLELRERSGMGILFITHNLGVVAEIADDVAVMYAGRIVEKAPAATLFTDAQHPYTLALLAAMPHLGGTVDRLEPIPGRMPPPWEEETGCRFAPRCPFATAECAGLPQLREIGANHHVACWRAPVEGLA